MAREVGDEACEQIADEQTLPITARPSASGAIRPRIQKGDPLGRPRAATR